MAPPFTCIAHLYCPFLSLYFNPFFSLIQNFSFSFPIVPSSSLQPIMAPPFTCMAYLYYPYLSLYFRLCVFLSLFFPYTELSIFPFSSLSLQPIMAPPFTCMAYLYNLFLSLYFHLCVVLTLFIPMQNFPFFVFYCAISPLFSPPWPHLSPVWPTCLCRAHLPIDTGTASLTHAGRAVPQSRQPSRPTPPMHSTLLHLQTPCPHFDTLLLPLPPLPPPLHSEAQSGGSRFSLSN